MGRLLARFLGCELLMTLKQQQQLILTDGDPTEELAMTSESHGLIFIKVTAFSKDVNFQIIFNYKMRVPKNVFPVFFLRQHCLQK